MENRILKFRVWDKVDYMSAPFTLQEWQLKTIQFTSDCPVMQFTGLTDKEGIEIYEGDLLREPAEDEWDKINYSCFEVFFHDGDANSDYNIGYSMNRMHNHGSICGGYIPSFKPKTTSKMIVFGNIYQNPELLTK